MAFESALIITPVGGTDFVLTEPLVYRDLDGTVYTVPSGFETDLESSPWYSQWLLTPDTYRSTCAALHDWLYKQKGFPKDKADNIYRRALLSEGVDRDTVERLYGAVHTFGESSYEADQGSK